MIERRKFQRIKVDLPTEYIYSQRQSLTGKALCKDISGGGARISLKEQLPLDEKLKFKIYKKNTSESISVNGKIIWTRETVEEKGYECGVEFQAHKEDLPFTSFMCNLLMEESLKETDNF